MADGGNIKDKLIGILTYNRFWINLLLIGAFFVVCVSLTFAWLNLYTRHSQAIEMPDFVGENIDTATTAAADLSFRVSITDSIYIVGKRGHVIVQQNPTPGSMVKENRTVYVTITKKSADKISFARLPILYGKDFDRKKRELFQSFQLESRVIDRRYDAGAPNHILEVRYDGKVIADEDGRKEDVQLDIGGTLEFVVSERVGGELEIPDLVCLTYAEARFIIENSKLELGEIVTTGSINNVDSAFVTGQVPDPGEGVMYMGDKIRLSLSSSKPFDCK